MNSGKYDFLLLLMLYDIIILWPLMADPRYLSGCRCDGV